MKLLRMLALTSFVALVGCASVEPNIGKFSEDKYFCSTVIGYQSYLEGYHVDLSYEQTWGVEELSELEAPAPSVTSGSPRATSSSGPQDGIPSELREALSNSGPIDYLVDEEAFEAPHEHGKRHEDNVSDRPVDITFCLEKGGEKIYFGWSDVKYREFVWSETPFSLRLAIERSCSLQSFPISTRGEYVKDSRIQVPSVRMRSFLTKARQSGESQVPNCPR